VPESSTVAGKMGRRLQRKPKELEATPVPGELREALTTAWNIIREAEGDLDECLGHGDAIQTDSLCGGRTGQSARPFEFTYHVSDGARWYLALSLQEIEDIAEGYLERLALHVCQTPGCGHKASSSEVPCACDWVEDPDFGNIKFPQAAATLERLGVDGIDSQSTKDDVLAQLGEPDEAGGGSGVAVGSIRIAPWVKYIRSDCQLRFEFGRSGRLVLISVLEPDWEPGR
jgi:hypothetical protein